MVPDAVGRQAKFGRKTLFCKVVDSKVSGETGDGEDKGDGKATIEGCGGLGVNDGKRGLEKRARVTRGVVSLDAGLEGIHWEREEGRSVLKDNGQS